MRLEKEGFHTYLIDAECDNSYFLTAEYPMIKNNMPPILLPMQVRDQDGDQAIYYEITGRVPLNEWIEKQKIGYREIRWILEGILELFYTLEDYMLTLDQIVLDKNQIFIDSKKQLTWMYGPKIRQNIQEDMEGFFLFLLSNTDYQDAEGVNFIHQIYSDIRKGGISKEGLREYLQIQAKDSEDLIFEDEPEQLSWEAEEDYHKPRRKQRNKVPIAKTEKQSFHIRKVGSLLFLLARIGLLFIDLLLMVYIVCGIYRYGYGQKVLLTLGIMALGLFALAFSIFQDMVSKKKSNSLNQKEERKEGGQDHFMEESVKERSINQFMKPTKSVFEELESHWGKGDETILLSDAIEEEAPSLYNPVTNQVIRMQVFPFYIGSEEGLNQLSLKNRSVSRQHAVIVRGQENSYYIEDLDSKNGTYVNKQRVIPEKALPVENGAEMIFANERWIFQALTPANIASIMDL